MLRRTLGALVLVMLTACASTPRLPHKRNDSAEAQRAAARYEVRVLTAGALDTSPVKISKKAFQQFRGVRLSAAGEVEAVAVPAERTFTLMLRRPGSSAAAAQTRIGVTIIIRHRGGKNSNMELHGRRMAEAFFRMITF